MKEELSDSKSILLQGFMLVTGGCNIYSGILSDNGIYINQQLGNNSAPKPDIKLPLPIEGHSIIKINESNVFMIGGIEKLYEHYSKKTFYWNIYSNEWKRGPDLKIGRSFHTAGVLIDQATNTKIVAVVGGEANGNWEAVDSVELLTQGQNAWSPGMFKIIIYLNLQKYS